MSCFRINSYDELIQNIEKGEYQLPHDIKISIEALSFISGMLRYNPETRLDIESLSKQYFITKDLSSFQNLKLNNTDKQFGYIMNEKKDENSALEDFLIMYGASNLEIVPSKTQGGKPLIEVQKGEIIDKKPIEDMIGVIHVQSDNEKNN